MCKGLIHSTTLKLNAVNKWTQHKSFVLISVRHLNVTVNSYLLCAVHTNTFNKWIMVATQRRPILGKSKSNTFQCVHCAWHIKWISDMCIKYENHTKHQFWCLVLYYHVWNPVREIIPRKLKFNMMRFIIHKNQKQR